MKDDLMWIYALLPDDACASIKDIIMAHEWQSQLSHRYLDFHLHISLKRSFKVTDLEAQSDLIERIIHEHGPLVCSDLEAELVKERIWLKVGGDEDLQQIHKILDRQLQERFGIIPDGYDRNYHPHVSLFKSADRKLLEKVFADLSQAMPKERYVIDRFVIGSRLSGNRSFRL